MRRAPVVVVLRPRSEAACLGLAVLLLTACAGAPRRPLAGPSSEPASPPEQVAAEPAATAEPTPEDTSAEVRPAVAAEPEAVAPRRTVEENPDRAALRERIVVAARRLLGTRPRLDCSGYVLAAYRAAGLSIALPPAANRSVALHGAGAPPPVPQPGDLAFFRDTFDRNRNGRVDDGITHVALVEAVDGDRVTLLHRGRKVERLRMDLANPSDHESNDAVRFRRTRDRRGTRYLSGELFVAFGALLDGAVTQTLQASRPADTGAAHRVRRWSRDTTSSGKPPPRASRSTPPPASSSSGRVASSASSRSTRRSSSRSSASADPGEPSPLAP